MIETETPRSVKIGRYLVKTGATVRAAATVFEISKSTVHKDVTERLKHEDRELYDEVRCVLDKNKEERHIRGGLATKQKFLDLNKKSTVKL